MYTADLETIIALPLNNEELALSYSKPAGWLIMQPLPVAAPGAFQPLAVVTGFAGAVFSVSMRPAPATGSLREWIAAADSADLREISVGPWEGFIAEAEYTAGVSRLMTRSLYFEDNDRLFVVSTAAPAEVFESLQIVLAEMMESVRLIAPRGAAVEAAPCDWMLA